MVAGVVVNRFFKRGYDFSILNAAHCLKITQNVAFEFSTFGIFHQFLSY